MENHDIRFITFPHTGTRTVKRIFDMSGVAYMHQHFNGEYRNKIIWDMSQPVVVLMKDPDEVRESWRKRYKTSRAHSGQFQRMWQEMVDLIADEKNEVFVIHIDDAEKRDDEMRAIAERIGKPIRPDWSLRLGADGA